MSLLGRVQLQQQESRQEQLRRGPDPADQALQTYLAHLHRERELKAATLTNYRRDIGEFLEFLRDGGVPSLAKVNRPILWQWRDYMMARGYSSLSIARRASEIGAFYAFLVRKGVLDSNPLVYLSIPKGEEPQKQPLTQKEVEMLLASTGGRGAVALRDRAIFELLYATGVRLSELWALNISQINLAEREMAILGTGRRKRLIPLGRVAAESLRAYLAEGRLVLQGETSTGALFLSRSGQRLSKRSLQALVQKAAERCGLEGKLTVSSLRDAFAAHLLAAGGDKGVVRLLLGSSRLNLKNGSKRQ